MRRVLNSDFINMKEKLEDYKNIHELVNDLLNDGCTLEVNRNGFYWQFRELCKDIKTHRRRQHETSFIKVINLIDEFLKKTYNLTDKQLFLSPSEHIATILIGWAWRNELI